jgi:hypothetical protein
LAMGATLFDGYKDGNGECLSHVDIGGRC